MTTPASASSPLDGTTDMTPEQRYELITRGLAEVLGGDAILAKLKEGKQLSLYWGTAPTGRPHCGYFVPLTKLGDFLKAGVRVKVLLADVHAFLDNLKAPVELVNHRVAYYTFVLTAVLRSLGVPLDKLEFVTGSSYQYSAAYSRDVYRLSSITSEHDAKKAGAEVVKQTSSPPLSGLLYPLLQALDEEHLGVDIQFGGVDQRKIFILAEQSLPTLGFARRAHLMNSMVAGLAGGKMSSSDPNSKIDFLDSPAEVKKKIKAAVAAPGVVEDNGLLAFIKAVILPIASLQVADKGKSSFVKPGQDGKEAPGGALVTFVRKEEYGGTVHYDAYEPIEQAYAKEELHPGDLKAFITESINALLAPVQEEFRTNPEFAKVEALAYPPPEPVKKVKKEKKIGTRAPNAEGGVEKAVENQTKEQKDGQSLEMDSLKESLPATSEKES